MQQSVFLDIKGNFDAAWPAAILKALINVKCPSYLTKMVQSYLENRIGYIQAEGQDIVSDIQLGCPKGSISSPFLWNILINELRKSKLNFLSSIIAYADGIVLLSHHKNSHKAVENLKSMC